MMLLKLFKVLLKDFKKKKSFYISSIKSDHATEFENKFFKTFYNENGISHTFSPKTPQQNEVVERKNMTLVEMARTMLHECNFLL